MPVRRIEVRSLGILLLLLSTVFPCLAAEKGTVASDFSGNWKLDADQSTANKRDLHASNILITAYGDRLQFDFMKGENVLNRDTFILDGLYYPAYSTRVVSKAFEAAKLETRTELVVRTRAILTVDGTMEYTETSTWSLSSDRKNLINKMTDGKLRVYVKQPPVNEPAHRESATTRGTSPQIN
jgi:hypothetical protein